jgi:hypothetical protein
MKLFTPLLILVSTSCAAAQDSRSVPVKGCSQISRARLGFGASYRGAVRNDDYKLSMTIPEGLTGWGADPVAPFHGFTIFLPADKGLLSCIAFEIHLRVDLGPLRIRRRGRELMVGGVKAWKEEATGEMDGTKLTNVTIRFSVPHGQEIDDGTVRMVTPARDLATNGPIFEEFLSHMRFDRQ